MWKTWKNFRYWYWMSWVIPYQFILKGISKLGKFLDIGMSWVIRFQFIFSKAYHWIICTDRPDLVSFFGVFDQRSILNCFSKRFTIYKTFTFFYICGLLRFIMWHSGATMSIVNGWKVEEAFFPFLQNDWSIPVLLTENVIKPKICNKVLAYRQISLLRPLYLVKTSDVWKKKLLPYMK